MKKILMLYILAFSHFSNAKTPKRILLYTHNGKGYVHENIAASIEALKKLCGENGYETEATDDPAVFTPEKLKVFACVIFSNTNNEAFDTDVQKQAFVDYIHKGGAFVGIHSASGSERQWPWFVSMLGEKFVDHPNLTKLRIKGSTI